MKQQLINHWPELLLASAVLVCYLGSPEQYALVPLAQIGNQWWRLITGHLLHTNQAHMLINMTGFSVVSLAFWSETRWQETSLVLLILMISTSLCLVLFTTLYYVGLSSILHGYLTYLLLRYWRSQPKFHSLFLLLILAKIISEQLSWLDLSSTQRLIAAPVAIDGHLFGTLAGLVLWQLQAMFRYIRAKRLIQA